ncbi:pectinesterase-like [Pyrus ussuriensis x Pyrus communis]|uniref:Pectinesterase-like n=1 Tax=Pyrus ussuriensis x Pyrus communis TaxID=2448454 RepID=A0A5N5HW08_9ROSA|nr:pectinesterase-like [Pyrus ussuriensis x Pyrus communis]
MKSTSNGLVDPAGRMPCNGSVGLSTLYYGEYMNSGGGADTSGRVKWLGYHVIRSTPDTKKFTVRNFLSGDSWISRIGVPFNSGLELPKLVL